MQLLFKFVNLAVKKILVTVLLESIQLRAFLASLITIYIITSFDCNEVSIAGFNSLRIQGRVYHHIGSIVLSEGESSKFV